MKQIVSSHSRHRCISLLLLCLVQVGVVQSGNSLDPVTNFCRRVGHGSTLRDGVLYINGGIETFVDIDSSTGKQDPTTITTGINENLLLVDMKTSWDSTTNVSITEQSHVMGGSVDGLSAPVNVQKGALYGGWPGGNDLYMFGGTTAGFNKSFPGYEIPSTPRYGLWYYDGDSDVWLPVDTSYWVSTVSSWGAFAEDAKSLGFWIGGQIDGGTAQSTEQLGDSTVGTGGLIVLTLRAHGMYNVTIPDFVKGNRRGAGMVYVENVGEAGILVLLGGRTKEDGFVPMQDISIFDLKTLDYTSNTTTTKGQGTTNMWYQQTAQGQLPTPRTDFCLVVATAPDNSSISIYMYAGRNDPEVFTDVYVLSLPSFTWVNVYNGQNPNWGHTCHRAGSRQMVVVGGSGGSEDVAVDCDQNSNGLSVLDLSTLTFGSVFDAQDSPYEVPEEVVSFIGGGPNGGAEMIEPANGWTNPGLANLFKQTTGNHASSSRKHGLSAGAIAGVVVGVVGTLGIASVSIFICIRRRRRRRHVQEQPPFQEEAARSELASTGIIPFKPPSESACNSNSGGTSSEGSQSRRISSRPRLSLRIHDLDRDGDPPFEME